MGAYENRIRELETMLHKADDERQTFVAHIARLTRRNELLQARLDESIGREARVQADAMDAPQVDAPLRQVMRLQVVTRVERRGAGMSSGRKAELRAQRLEAIHQALRVAGGPLTVQGLADATGLSYQTMYAFLYAPRDDYGLEKVKFPDGTLAIQPVREMATA
jgi:hypothetical protein